MEFENFAGRWKASVEDFSEEWDKEEYIHSCSSRNIIAT